LAIINLVPIPILDGGHLLFFLIELIKGRPVNLKIREVAQQIGLFIILLLVILVFYNDIFRYKDNILEFLKGIF
jgi:regulator of sigma E protease